MATKEQLSFVDERDLAPVQSKRRRNEKSETEIDFPDDMEQNPNMIDGDLNTVHEDPNAWRDEDGDAVMRDSEPASSSTPLEAVERSERSVIPGAASSIIPLFVCRTDTAISHRRFLLSQPLLQVNCNRG